MSDRHVPEINAGSMADIAFLLLIFFLVTTTLDTEVGIAKLLSKNVESEIRVNERNVFEITINEHDEIQLENAQIIPIENLKQHIINFIDNGASTDQNGNTCYWCKGLKDHTSSDHPAKAIVSLETSRNTSYNTYIAVQNEIHTAYTYLRDYLALSLYETTYTELVNTFKKDKTNLALKAKVEEIQNKYPIHISELAPFD